MDKPNRHVAIKMIIFAFLVALLFWYLGKVFTFPRSRIGESTSGDFSRQRFNTFYAQEDNVIDCVFLGTSGTDRYWMPAFAWKELGITTYSLTTPSQQVMFDKYLIREVLKTQDVKVFVIDLRTMVRPPEKTNNEITRRVTDNMRRSRNWLDTVIDCRRIIKADGGKPERLLSYLYPPFKYHSAWKDLRLDDLIEPFPKTEYMCYFGSKYFYGTRKRNSKPPVVTDKTVPIPEQNLPIIDDLLDQCRELDAEVIFISTPMKANAELQGKLNYAQKYVEDAGFRVFNCNTQEMYDYFDWDFSNDQYDKEHASFSGAVKFTRYLGNVLVKEYGLEDHRNEEDQSVYKDWETGYANTMAAAEEYCPDFYRELTESAGE